MSQAKDISPTPRQRELLRWLSLGKSNNEIAQIMQLSPATVKNHLAKLTKLYGINCENSRLLVVVFALVRDDIPADHLAELHQVVEKSLAHSVSHQAHRGT